MQYLCKCQEDTKAKEFEMNKESVKARLREIQEEMTVLHETRIEAARNLATQMGVEDDRGINLDELSSWARYIKKLNTQLRDLADERRELRGVKRELSPCTCNCH
jgi:predicted  nucleic acid-binding Zn-ribbon protein